jgi:Holliday junction resolvase RusA-like endonuclease
MEETRIIIKTLTPSLNKLLRMNRWKVAELKQTLAWEVFTELHEQNPDYEVIMTPRKMKMQIISYRKSFLDKDNLWGGLKPLVDAIKELRLIYDDSVEFLNLKAEQRIEKKRKNQRTEITISHVSP